MKRIFLVISIALLGLLFAGTQMDSTALGLQLLVPQIHEVKLSTTDETTVSGFNTSTAVSQVVFDMETLDSDEYYMLIKTNNPGAVYTEVVLTNLKSTGVSTEVAFAFYVDGVLLDSSTTAGVTSLMYTADTTLVNGLRVLSVPFSISLVVDDVYGAIPATYVANVAFNLLAP